MLFKKFSTFKKNALTFKIQNDHLFKRNSKNVLLRKVIDDMQKRLRILKHLHDESEYRDREDTYKRITDRY